MPDADEGTISLTVNGALRDCQADPRTPLLTVLREELGLRGTKYGCGEGECGACTVIVDGKTVCACLATVASVHGAEVTTVEGLANDPIGVRLFNAFAAAGAVQCGFCTPGFILSGWQLLARAGDVDRSVVQDALGGNLCRCTGYTRIIDAITEVSALPPPSPLVNRVASRHESFRSARRYWRPAALEELVEGLGSFDPAVKIIAGGTDLMVQHEHRLQLLSLVDISAVTELAGISDGGDHVRIGATATWSEIRRSELLTRWAPLLPIAAGEVGGIQIQNRATIGGNIVNASPAADGLPALYAYGASVVIGSAAGLRQLPITAFIRSPGKTSLEPGELVTEIRVPKSDAEGQLISFFEKVGSRKAQTITKGSVAFHGRLQNGRLFDVRIALGSVGPTVIRATEAEQALERDCTPDCVSEASRLVSAAAMPIDDVRSTADYRRALVGGLLLRGLWKAEPRFQAKGEDSRAIQPDADRC